MPDPELDVLLAVRDTVHADFAAGWRDWLESVTEVLLAHQLRRPGSFFATTRECLRLDVLVEAVSELAEPLPAMGVKQWSSRLTPRQRDVLAGLPQPRATRDEVIGAMQAVRHAFRSFGRDTARAVGLDWPDDLDRCCCRQLLGRSRALTR